MEKTLEKDLFEPIKKYFENFGYVCDGEVKDIDLYMEKATDSDPTDPDNEYNSNCVAVELKVDLNFKAIQQAALRQKIVETVFIGIYRPNDMFSHSFKDKLYLLKRLGIGLIVVAKSTGAVQIVSEPVVSELSTFQQRNKGKKKSISAEFQKRKVKSNTGGVHSTKLMTSYREDALLVLDAFANLGGEALTKDITKASGIKKTAAILRGNYYGWFEKIESGRYRIKDSGYDALEEFEDALIVLRAQNNKAND